MRVRDQAGAPSAWSEPASWSMGLLDPADWKAKWIGTDAVHVRRKGWPVPDNTMPDPWFRKQFTLDAVPVRAMLYVASIGFHEVYVNGRKVGDTVLAPCATNHKKRARYCTYNIAPYLKPGKNVLGLWLGTSWSIFPPYKSDDRPASPLVLAQAEVELPGASCLRIATDASWRTHASPNTLLGVWDFMHFGGERYDANLELPQWCEADLDEADWKPAKVFAPRLTLSAEMVEPNRRQKSIRPIAVEQRPGGEYRVDMGVNFAGFVEIDVRGQPGRQIDFQFSERADKSMTHQLHSAYILGPAGKGTFRNRFNYSVGRWITIKGLEAKPALANVRGWLVRTDYRRAADFECSNTLLNDLYRMTLWTFENLSLGGYVVDCPHRERMGYGGDAHATTETALNSYHLGAFYTKWAQDWRDVQGNAAAWGVNVKAGQSGSGGPAEDGNLPYTAPTYWGGGGPGWSGYCITLPWLMYRQYGDVRILEQSFPTIERWLGFLETKSSGDMLVPGAASGIFSAIGSGRAPRASTATRPRPCSSTTATGSTTCKRRHKSPTRSAATRRPTKYRQRAQAVRRAVHAKFFRPQDNSYVDGLQAYLSIALLVDLPPEELRPAVWKRLADEILTRRKGHIHAGITGGYFVIKNLVENGRDDLILTMATKDDYPSWGHMLRQGRPPSGNRGKATIRSCTVPICTWGCGSWKGWAESGPIPIPRTADSRTSLSVRASRKRGKAAWSGSAPATSRSTARS